MAAGWLTLSSEVAAALAENRPVVALESTLIAHGLPRPVNLATAHDAQAAVRAMGAIPATIAIWHGKPTIAIGRTLAELADSPLGSRRAAATSRRDRLERLAATTVSATMAPAHAAGIGVFATGGSARIEIRNPSTSPRPHRTGTNADVGRVPGRRAFCTCRERWRFSKRSACRFSVTARMSSRRLPSRSRDYRCRVASSRREAAAVFRTLRPARGARCWQPCPADVAVPADEFAKWLALAEAEARPAYRCEGHAVSTARLAELSGGRTLAANRAGRQRPPHRAEVAALTQVDDLSVADLDQIAEGLLVDALLLRYRTDPSQNTAWKPSAKTALPSFGGLPERTEDHPASSRSPARRARRP